ncbi:MAG: sigma-54 dependent transcriptional regulator [Longimicrobiales bacterium]|nr:sigma-54 dependent transcriptional regulator [Longimicrobiales bacterium]
MSRSVLLVDDDGGILTVLSRFFEKRDWSVLRAATGARALDHYGAERPDLVLLDLQLPDMNGLPVLRRLRELDEDARVIMLTGHGDIETAVEAMRLGAANFLTKPIELDHLGAIIEGQEERIALRRRVRAATDGGPELASDLGPSEGMRAIADRIDRIAAGDGTVLLQGETGTGKGWVARRIHDHSDRRGRPFVEVNCGGLSATFLDSELFGHEKGAFTDAKDRKEGLFEVADGGTIFLDEIGDLSPELQPKLLKVLENRRFRRLGGTREIAVDVRLIAATNRALEDQVRSGGFREDLYYRLNVLPLELPALRDRSPDDVAWLAHRILAELADAINGGPTTFSDDALRLLVQYDWPGNIREMRNVLERILILAGDTEQITRSRLPAEMRSGPKADRGEPMTLEEVERRHLARVLERTEGNRSQAARLLGISRAALYDKMDRFGLRAVGR